MQVNTPVWFITGCSTGLGRALAKRVLDRGWRVVVTARDKTTVADLVTEGQTHGLRGIETPRHLVPGTWGVDAVDKHLLELRKEFEAWRTMGAATDYDAA